MQRPWYQKGLSRVIAPGSNECGSLNHCARLVFLSHAIDCTGSPSYLLCSESGSSLPTVVRCSCSAGPHVIFRSHLDLNFDVASLLAPFSVFVGFSSSFPSFLALVAALLLLFPPLPPPLLPVHPPLLRPPPSPPPPRPRCPFASLPGLPLPFLLLPAYHFVTHELLLHPDLRFCPVRAECERRVVCSLRELRPCGGTGRRPSKDMPAVSATSVLRMQTVKV